MPIQAQAGDWIGIPRVLTLCLVRTGLDFCQTGDRFIHAHLVCVHKRTHTADRAGGVCHAEEAVCQSSVRATRGEGYQAMGETL